MNLVAGEAGPATKRRRVVAPQPLEPVCAIHLIFILYFTSSSKWRANKLPFLFPLGANIILGLSKYS